MFQLSSTIFCCIFSFLIDGNEYCASVGEDLFVDRDAFLASEEDVDAFCRSACGHAILRQYDAEYTAKKNCAFL